jgi:competence protein CoiA
MECGAPVRLREGLFRQAHFFHLKQDTRCRQNGKTLSHLQLQVFLKQTLPKNEAHLEYKFNTISRIADVAWLPQKIVFEIQCSPIAKDEMLERIKDYQSVGFQVVWIMHDSRYNQLRLTPVEQALLPLTHYYSNMNEEGKGIIYDQWHYLDKGIRKLSLGRLLINVNQPYFKNKLGFSGDINSLPEDHPYLLNIQTQQARIASTKKTQKFLSILNSIKESFYNFFKSLLKPYCD